MPPSLPAAAPQNKPKLLDQVRDVIRRKHFTVRTGTKFVDWIRRFILFHNKRHPREMAEAKVTGFLTHLARDGRTLTFGVKLTLTCIYCCTYSRVKWSS